MTEVGIREAAKVVSHLASQALDRILIQYCLPTTVLKHRKNKSKSSKKLFLALLGRKLSWH